jgi:hypothetical protein
MLRIFLAAIFMFIIGLTKAQDKIFWSENRKLVWEDFQSKPAEHFQSCCYNLLWNLLFVE